MKNSLLIIISFFTIFLFASCEKDTLVDTQQENIEPEARSSGVICVTCEAIDVSLSELSKVGDCTTSILTIELNNPDCNASTRHMVYMGEELLTYFNSRTLDVEIEYCEDKEQDLIVVGYNPEEEKWNSVCFKASMGGFVNKPLKLSLTYIDLLEE